MHEPGARETAVVLEGALRLHCDGADHDLGDGRLGHLRLRPAAPLREPGQEADALPRRRHRRAAEELNVASTLFDKIWDAHEVAPGPDLHRPPPGPRGHLAAGVREPAPGRPHGAPPGPHARDGRPQRADRRLDRRRPDPRPPLARPGRDARAQLPRVRRARLLDRVEPPGDRPRDRPRAGRDAAGHDDRLRRLAHRRRTAPSARSRSGSARARSSTSSPRRRCRSRSRARW